MQIPNKATSIRLFNFSTPQMRAFHLSWFAFFLCFFAWFGIAPLMPLIREEMSLSAAQVGNLIIASVAATVFARLFIGWLCDRIGPRYSYSLLLMIGSLPVMGVSLVETYEGLLFCRLLIGCIGASFVITQFHTTLMFAPNCVGTANATTAGWGNLGGGVTQMAMPLLMSFMTFLTANEALGWRLAMVVAGGICFCTGIAYFFLTQDTPNGTYKELRKEQGSKDSPKGSIKKVVKDYRVWLLFLVYGSSFGIELTINNMAAMYYVDQFGLSAVAAGRIAMLFGLMNLFARTLGGFFGDRLGRKWGLNGRVRWLCIALLCEGIALLCFSQMHILPLAITSMVIFSLFTQMSEGATYSVVPFINKRSIGLVSGIVGAGGNVGAVCAGFLFKTDSSWWPTALFILGCCVSFCAMLTLFIRFRPAEEQIAHQEISELRLAQINADAATAQSSNKEPAAA